MDGSSMEAYFFQVFLALPDSAESPTACGFGRDCLFHTTIVLLGELHYTYTI
jgi:hypothetical protein